MLALLAIVATPRPGLRAQRRPAAPEVTGYELDNNRCLEAFTGVEAVTRMPLGGSMGTGSGQTTTLSVQDPSARARQTLETWIASTPLPGRRFIVSPLLNEQARTTGFEARCVVARALVTTADVTLGPATPTSPPSRWVQRSILLSDAARARVNDSLAQRVAFFGARDAYLGWASVGALASGNTTLRLDFLR